MKVQILFGIIGKYGKLKRGDELEVDPEYAGMLVANGNGKIVEEKKPAEKKPKANKSAKPKSNK